MTIGEHVSSADGRRRAQGSRRLQQSDLALAELSERFRGLAPNLSPSECLGALKAAEPGLGLRPGLVDAVDRLMRFTRPQDWTRGARPIVWPSNDRLAELWGVARSTIKRRIRGLVDGGLILVKESPSGRRDGRRDKSGKIVWAYGFDLTPLALRYREFQAIALDLEQSRQRRREARRRATRARRRSWQVVELLERSRVAEADLMRHRASALRVETLWAETKRTDDAGALERLVAEAENEEEMLEAAARVLLLVEKDPEGPAGGPPSTTTTELRFNSGRVVPAAQRMSSAADECRFAARPAADVSPPRGAGGDGGSAMAAGGRARDGGAEAEAEAEDRNPVMTPVRVLRLAPELGLYLAGQGPGDRLTWPMIVDAADRYRGDAFRISPALWVEACTILGRERAALAVAIVAAKLRELEPGDAGYPRDPAGYYRGMVRKAHAGKLNLQASIFGLWRRRAGRAAVKAEAELRP